jgi:excisionase family DNA binding protein
LPLHVHHVAVRLKVCRRTVRWWAETGRLPAQRVNKRAWGFTEEDVDAFSKSRVSPSETA